MPVFSIIVPVYKTEQYIERCVTSILNQTYKDFELILIDDGSPDRCPRMCDEYQKLDSRVKVIHKKKWWCIISTQLWLGNSKRNVCLVCG